MDALGVVTGRHGVDLRTELGSACGTFGELLQGALPAGSGIDEFLVTLPVDRRSRAWFRLEPAGVLRVYPTHKWKSRQLAATLLETHGRDAGGTLLIDSDIAVGKGMASSSADLVATARAVGAALELRPTPALIEEWLRPIEPTDGVMYAGAVLFEHREVRLARHLGTLPALTVVAVDEGGLVDTVEFNRRPTRYSSAQRRRYAELLDRLAYGLATADLATVGAVATQSAILNQDRQPKRTLTAMLNVRASEGALGVVCAHSGTMLGILLADDDIGHARRLARVRAACESIGGPGSVSVLHTVIHQ